MPLTYYHDSLTQTYGTQPQGRVMDPTISGSATGITSVVAGRASGVTLHRWWPTSGMGYTDWEPGVIQNVLNVTSCTSTVTYRTLNTFRDTAGNFAGAAFTQYITGTGIKVFEPIQFPGQTGEVTTRPEFTITASNSNMTDGTLGISVRNANSRVETPWRLPVTPPNPPTNLAATSDTDSIDLSWTAPTSGSTPDSYRVVRKNNLLVGDKANFTSSTNGWFPTSTAATISHNSTDGRMVLTATVTTAAGIRGIDSANLAATGTPVSPGATVEFSGFYRVSSGARPVYARLAFYNASGSITGSSVTSTNNFSSTMTQFSVIATAPADAAYASPSIFVDGSGGVIGDSAEIDNVSITSPQNFTVPAPTTSYSDTSVLPDTIYTYSVRSVSSNTESLDSNSVQSQLVAGPATAPGQVTGLTVTGLTGDSVSLSWTAPSTGTQPMTYTIYRNGQSAGSVVTSTTYTDTGLSSGTAYSYYVVASNSAGSGTASTTVNGTTTTPPQTISPSADGTIVGAWATNTGDTTNLYAAIDEASPGSLADFVESPTGAAAEDMYRCVFGAAQTPALNTGHRITVRHGKDATGGQSVSLVLSLRQGTTTVIAQRSFDTAQLETTDITSVMDLTEAEAAAITDYDALRLEFNPTFGGGQKRAYRIYWAQMELPPAAPKPNAPTNLTFTTDSDSINLSWSAPASGEPVAYYEISRVEDANPQVVITNVTSTTYSDIAPPISGTYTYKVRAATVFDAKSVWSSTVQTTWALNAPTGLTATGSASSISLAWSAPTATAGPSPTDYRINKSTTYPSVITSDSSTFTTGVGDWLPTSNVTISAIGGVMRAEATTTGTMEPTITVPVVEGRDYTFSGLFRNASGTRVIQVNFDWLNSSQLSIGGGAGSFTPGATMATYTRAFGVAPAGAAFVKVGLSSYMSGGGAGLVGDAFEVDDITVTAAPASTNFLIGTTATNYTDASVVPDAQYTYKVLAVASGYNSAESNSASASLVTTPRAPSGFTGNLTITNPASKSLGISWSAATDLGNPTSTYRVEQSVDGGGNWTVIRSSISATSVTVTGLTNGQTYTYRVTVFNASGSVVGPNASGTPQGLARFNNNEMGVDELAVSATNSVGVGQNEYNIYYSNTAVVFDNARAKSGTFSLRSQHLSGTAGSSMAGWDFRTEAKPTLYQRVYLYATAFPTANAAIVRIGTSADGVVDTITLTTTGMLMLSGTTTTQAIELNKFVRIEFMTSATGTELRLYNDTESTTATQIVTGATAEAAVGTVRYGVNAVTSYGPIWLDDLAVSEDTWLGPSSVTPPPPPPVTVEFAAFGIPL